MLPIKKSFWGKRPGFDAGDFLHIVVNVGFACVLYTTVVYWKLAFLAALLVVLSKWRILAVQPRFWLPNIKANMVDLTVGISIVVLMQQANRSAAVALFWGLLYMGWLLFLKPKQREGWVALQALVAQFLGLTVLFMVPSLVKNALLLTIGGWIVSWVVARHFFSTYGEPHAQSLSLGWAFLMSQLVWVGLHWVQYYIVFDVKFATVALIATIIGASSGAIYHAYKAGKANKGILLENGLFGVALITVILIASRWSARA